MKIQNFLVIWSYLTISVQTHQTDVHCLKMVCWTLVLEYSGQIFSSLWIFFEAWHADDSLDWFEESLDSLLPTTVYYSRLDEKNIEKLYYDRLPMFFFLITINYYCLSMFPTGCSSNNPVSAASGCEGKAYVQFASKASAEAPKNRVKNEAKVGFIDIIWQ